MSLPSLDLMSVIEITISLVSFSPLTIDITAVIASRRDEISLAATDICSADMSYLNGAFDFEV